MIGRQGRRIDMKSLGRVGCTALAVFALVPSMVVVAGGNASAGLSADADTPGVRLGPLESACVDVPSAAEGDVAIVNATVVDTSGDGFATVANEGADPNATSSLNFVENSTLPNLTMTSLTDRRQVCLTLSQTSSADVVLDLTGVLSAGSFTRAAAGAVRILDTRSSARIEPGATVCTTVPNAHPGELAVVNATVTSPTDGGFLTVHPTAVDVPSTTSTHNFDAGETVANLTVTAVGDDGRICATVSAGSAAHLILDLAGTIHADLSKRSGARPARVLDTRFAGVPVEAGQASCVIVPDTVPGDVAVANVTIDAPTAAGYATVHPIGADPNATSTHNFPVGGAVSNLTMTALGSDGRLCVTVADAAANVIVDLIDVIAAEAFVASPNGRVERILDTRDGRKWSGRDGAYALEQGVTCEDLLARFVEPRVAELDAQIASIEAYRAGQESGTTPSTGTLPATGELPRDGGGDEDVPDFTDTNTQAEGVDEGDTVETDGRYVYQLAPITRTGTYPLWELRIVEIKSATTVAQLALPDSAQQMILYGDRILVASRPIGDSRWTSLTTIDVSDRTAPHVVQTDRVDGDLLALRAIDGKARTVLASYRQPYDQRTGNVDSLDRLRTTRDIVRASGIDDWLPQIAPMQVDGTQGPSRRAVSCEALAVPANGNIGTRTVWIAETDLNGDTTPNGSTGLRTEEWNSMVSASHEHLYIVAGSPWQARSTAIHAFAMSATEPAAYITSTQLPGRALNQFALGEHNGVLRVALTSGFWQGSSSAVFALRLKSSGFERLSMITNLGPTEEIYAVRHVGDASYIVTYARWDPLYVIDFSDPDHPALRGELKIPGFSNSLHPIGGDRLIGIGRASPNGRTQISLFDVSDPTQPQRLSVTDLPGGTAATYDHHAFVYWPATNTIVIPNW